MCPSAILSVADKSAHMAQVDPHGWVVTLIAVGVVFLSLLVLFGAYSLIGALCNPSQVSKQFVRKLRRRLARRTRAAGEGDGTSDPEVAAAIALALHLYEEENAHDEESYILTIKRK